MKISRSAPYSRMLSRAAVFAACLSFLSCVSTGTPPPADTVGEKGNTSGNTVDSPSRSADNPSQALGELYKKGLDALDNSQTVEAIKAFVSVLADFETSPSQPADAMKIRDQANLQLTKIGAGLFVEPGAEWVDKTTGKQIAGSTRTAGKSGGMNPSVALYENFGAGRVYVRGAGIAFEFTANSGALNQLVTTDDEGKANSVISRVDDPGKEIAVRAFPFFRVKGYSYAFKNVAREFTWLPPANTCVVVTLEKSEFGASKNPLSADAVGTILKKAGYDVRPVNAETSQKAFLEAFAGTVPSIRAVSGDASPSYIALVYIECAETKQVEYNGEKFEMYTAFAKATMRLVREDGTILYTIPLEKIRGDGGNRQAAVDKSLKTARELLVADMEKNLQAIKSAAGR